MVREAIADDARRHGDDAVRRIREASARRIDRTGRVRAFASWCALATLAGGISLAALEVRNERIRDEVRRSPPVTAASMPNACATLVKALVASDARRSEDLRRAKTIEEITFARAQAAARRKAVFKAAAESCPPAPVFECGL